MVLKGALNVISEVRPVFYIEVGNNVSAEVLGLFTSHDYIAVSPEGEVLKERCAPNTFFIPIENKKAQQDAGVNVANAP